MAMREYNRVSGRFWTGRTGKAIRQLGRDHQVVALYLLTCPSVSWIGIYYLPIPTLCHEVGMDAATAVDVLNDLAGIDFAHYDDDTEHVWVPNAALYQIGRTLEGEKNNLRTGVVNDLAALNGHRFVGEFIARYSTAYRLGSPLQVPSEGSDGAALPPSEGSERTSGPLRYTERESATAPAPATETAPAPAPASEESPTGAGKRRRPPSASRFVPDDFVLTEDLQAHAMRQGLDSAAIGEELAKFREYEFSRPIHDWPRAWRRWATNAVQYRRERKGAPGRTHGQHAADRTMDAIHEAFGRKP